jgi:catechol 2,3-dioxygenase-like lactoylglutathione lyase family enzyme
MERAIPILPAGNLAAAKSFYVNRLGFRVIFEASEDGRSGLLERGTIELTIDCPMDGHGRNACVSLHVDDADAYYREWSAKTAVLRAPKDEEWGARTFDLLDPSGNTIFVIGPAKEGTQPMGVRPDDCLKQSAATVPARASEADPRRRSGS